MLFLSLVAGLVAIVSAPLLSRGLRLNTGWVLTVPLLAAALFVIIASVSSSNPVIEQSVSWIPSLEVDLALRLDGLSLAFALLVLIIGAAVMYYSADYLGQGNHWSFYMLMAAFATAMLVLVLAGDLVVLYVAWEITTLCSFLLISRSGPAAREPAIRTLLVTAAGGLSLLAAIVMIWVETGTTNVSAVLADPIWTNDPGFASIVAVLLAGAAFTKSAQFPFQFWLPDSMVAITPVSAYLHAAAMVKAGVFLLLRFSPVLADVATWQVLLVSSGLFTALLGAKTALGCNDLKELLAYSTTSQLGLLVAMIGVGTPEALTAAIVHTLAHGLFKSALFMLVGIIDHQTGTRDIRRLAEMRLRMPITAGALGLASMSMAGLPFLLGFVSKESMFAAFLDAHESAWVSTSIAAVAAAVSVLTFAYSGRIVMGAFSGKSGRRVPEAPVSLWGAPAACSLAGLVFGLAPFLLDQPVSDAASAVTGIHVEPHLALWHGVNAPLGISIFVVSSGVILILLRRQVEQALVPFQLPISGLDIVDTLRANTIRLGAIVGGWAGSTDPRRHLGIPMVCIVAIAVVGLLTIGDLPDVTANPSRWSDWILVALIAAGVFAAVQVRSRIGAIVVTGIVGFAMTLWFFALGATDVAMTQLLVEILTVCVMVLVLRRLPVKFSRDPVRRNAPAIAIAMGAGAATTIGVLALTGRRDASDAAEYYLRQGEDVTGGANIVNTILVDFRALDTLGEITVLGVAGMAIAALLSNRRSTPTQPGSVNEKVPLADARENGVFIRTMTRAILPILILLSLWLLFRGHQEPGGGFISALVAGAALALIYLAAPTDSTSSVRLPYLALIGTGISIGAATGFLGYFQGSFLTPLHFEVLGIAISTPLIFDLGVYLTVIGIVLAAFNLMGSDAASGPPKSRSSYHKRQSIVADEVNSP